MEKSAVHAILLQHGRWIESSEFIDLIAAGANVKERQARNLVKKAYEKKDVQKQIFADRRVWYGLEEFGPPTAEKSPIMESSNQTTSEPEPQAAPEVPTTIEQTIEQTAEVTEYFQTSVAGEKDPVAQARAAQVYSTFLKSQTTLQLEADAERDFQNRFKRANQK